MPLQPKGDIPLVSLDRVHLLENHLPITMSGQIKYGFSDRDIRLSVHIDERVKKRPQNGTDQHYLLVE